MQGKEEIQASSWNLEKERLLWFKVGHPKSPKVGSREPRPLDTAVWPTSCSCDDILGDPCPWNPASLTASALAWPSIQAGRKKAGQGANPVSLCEDVRVILGSRLQGPGWHGAGANLD